MQIQVTCPIYPTEDKSRIETALTNLFIDSCFEEKVLHMHTVIHLTGSKKEILIWLRDRIHTNRVIDAFRSKLMTNWDGQESILHLDKQTAHKGKLRLVDYPDFVPPLGCIEILMVFESTSEFEEFILWFTPPTKDGHIVYD